MAGSSIHPFENKLQRGVSFSVAELRGVICPRLPRNPPQLDHKKTTFCTPLFPKHPSKSP
jgi:hypothetical protein